MNNTTTQREHIEYPTAEALKTLDYWHPVLPSSKLKRKPVSVTLCNQAIVLFRTEQGIAALEDRCPHRRMQLSQGWVEGQHLVCPYHGWSYDRTGKAAISGASDICNSSCPSA